MVGAPKEDPEAVAAAELGRVNADGSKGIPEYPLDLLRQRLMRPFSSMIDRIADWVIVLLHEIAMATYGKCLWLGRY